MSSPSFRFRRFEVFHDRCAMKVGTDGVLLGAWAGQSLQTSQSLQSSQCKDVDALPHPVGENSTSFDDSFPVLDIGTGSGLVALMLAQRFPLAHITALDIEPSAVEQAQYNFANSPWPDRLSAVQSSLQSFQSTAKFRLIVSNPPYFQNSLKNPDKARELARHTDTLSYSDLVTHTARLLAEGGLACYILPAEAEAELLSLLHAHALYPVRILQVHSKPSKPAKRILLEFTNSRPTLSPTFFEDNSYVSLDDSSPAFEDDSSPAFEDDSSPAFEDNSSHVFEENEGTDFSSTTDPQKSAKSRTIPEPTPSKSRSIPEPTRSIFYIESLSSPRSDEYASLTRDFYL